ncbi:Rne/Rng family ribonuclease [Thioclava sp. A2]|uniref:Rne/Rng family ribonuclease n=1 Tax=Thioclava sp. FCG-A2 TaxID=3080562 RepID=UPI002952C961|nr:Rne/Rng family ribonuclease [Thioclava sp. A2]MDV7272220.1 Rne/Rng family ribonuclease [Thioclava sp. A2]
MAKKMLIDATHAEETRVVVVDGNKVEEFDFETINKRQLAGNIYLAKVTRVEPSLQAAFVDYGGNRHGFLAFAEIHPDYYQIPVADREALLEEERRYAEAAEEQEERSSRSRRRRRGGPKAEKAAADPEVKSDEIPGMELVDAEETDAPAAEVVEGAPAEAAVEGDAPVAEEAVASEEVVEAPAEAETEEVEAEEASEDDGDDSDASEDDDNHDHDHHAHPTDESIESVADEDVEEEIRPARKPRPRRYKIQEVIKVRQIMLVQVVKEERGNKGAALTTYLSLAGRYCVLMPNTARGGGISRKITNAVDRKKLKEIATEVEVPKGAGLIIRTAGAQRTRTEIKRDYEYLLRLWEQIRELTMHSVAPAPIYEEGDLIKRSIRDLYSKDIDEVLVEGDRGYRAAKDFMKMIMPSHAKNVKHYNEQLPLFSRFQVEGYLGQMFNPVVQLKSGGYIVIGVTEALVAIDVNSGRATKEGSIEETALKTNLEAAEEVARQLRLRDLAGLIVIDFIDMEERKNNVSVEKRLKDKLKTDRARIQVGRISGFGLLEMSRQRLRPGMLESTTQPCPHCHGTGLIRSDDSLALTVLRAIEEEGTRKRAREVLVKVPVAVANYLMNAKREHVATIEARYGLSVRIEADPALVSPDFTIERFKTATRVVPEVEHLDVVSASASLMAEVDEDVVEEDDIDEAEAEEVEAEAVAADEQPKKKRRRRRRRKRKSDEDGVSDQSSDEDGDEDEADDASEVAPSGEAPAAEEVADEKPKRKRTRSRKKPVVEEAPAEAEGEAAPVAETIVEEAPAAEATVEEKPKRKRAPRSRKKVDAEVSAEAVTEEAPAAEETVEEKPKRKRATRSRKKVEEAASEEAPKPAETPIEAPAEEPVEAPVEAPAETPVETPAEAPVEAPVETPAEAPVELPSEPMAEAVATPEEPAKPRRSGWWSR